MNLSSKAIKPVGIFDGTTALSFKQEISQALTDQAGVIIVNFQDVSFIDSSGLGALVAAQKIIKSEGKKLIFCGFNAQVKMIFELTNLDRAFEIFPTLDAVHNHLQSP
ncbi:STAS domain-containing protein [Prochlorothrix hollandica]|uniref:Anti-sigma factor antagonist n=1 Tax=Prochlorothrix hollandica PCC 9006 = CALU 1027 TaxID=317619 RepID=A0A0M2Q319_PROHO|nr:STAS domain-containing protein [Prochlorothrix hollandica]KKJ00997.1 anti-sigma factor antagonist [Prochlorothrix hollandica PCC 9006 = CALU 1027]